MKYEEAIEITEQVKEELAPHCERIEISRIVRNNNLEAKRIEIVAIHKPFEFTPEPYNVGLFESGIESVLSRWHKVHGELPCNYMQFIIRGSIKLDLLFVEEDRWSKVIALRKRELEYSI